MHAALSFPFCSLFFYSVLLTIIVGTFKQRRRSTQSNIVDILDHEKSLNSVKNGYNVDHFHLNKNVSLQTCTCFICAEKDRLFHEQTNRNERANDLLKHETAAKAQEAHETEITRSFARRNSNGSELTSPEVNANER